MAILTIENLCKTYQSGDNIVKALDNVSFSVEQGEFVAIVGPSGSGKSTLLHILGGVDYPTSGNVLVDGVALYTLNESQLAIFRRRHIGLIYQFYNLIPVLDVVENITLPNRGSRAVGNYAAAVGFTRATSSFAQSIIGWSAAKSFYWQSVDQSSGVGFG